MSLEVKRYEYGDVIVKASGPMTASELIEALGHMPQDAFVDLYCDERMVSEASYQEGDGFVRLRDH